MTLQAVETQQGLWQAINIWEIYWIDMQVRLIISPTRTLYANTSEPSSDIGFLADVIK
jgi:hypothetical protein